jgi:endo-1,4-beta-xylanase
MKAILPQGLLPLFLLCSIITSCKKELNSSCAQEDASLSAKVNFPLGIEADIDQLEYDLIYKGLSLKHFNSFTAGNIMKPDYLHPAPGVFNWLEADRLVNFAHQHKVRVHGHTLIWHQQLPAWMENFEGDRTQWDELLKHHIYSIVSHFKGKVNSWDVVNEAFNDDGSLRNTIWKQHLGAAYIEKAFRYAHEADPNCKLFYNDYSICLNPVKRKAILAYLNSLKSKGVPIHGIGAQMHVFLAFPSNKEISDALDDLWQAGYLLHLSELDVSLNPLAVKMPFADAEDLEQQAERYLAIFKMYNRIPRAQQFGITIWGLSDADSWIPSYFNRDDYPLIFDQNYAPKAAFCALISNL